MAQTPLGFNMTLYQSTGILRYGEGNCGLKLVVEIDSQIVEFYRSLIPRYYGVKRQLYKPHISIVRKEDVINIEFWGKYQDVTTNFTYSPIIHHDNKYWWLDVYWGDFNKIRRELGLNDRKVFHITLGNTKWVAP